jgi:hypothetical protein
MNWIIILKHCAIKKIDDENKQQELLKLKMKEKELKQLEELKQKYPTT